MNPNAPSPATRECVESDFPTRLETMPMSLLACLLQRCCEGYATDVSRDAIAAEHLLVYLIVRRVEGFEPGAYCYEPSSRRLWQVAGTRLPRGRPKRRAVARGAGWNRRSERDAGPSWRYPNGSPTTRQSMVQSPQHARRGCCPTRLTPLYNMNYFAELHWASRWTGWIAYSGCLPD